MVPTTAILITFTNTLEVSLDFLLLDVEEDKFLIKGLLDAFIKKCKFEKLAHT